MKRRRRGYQFSLRFFLVVPLLVGLGARWVQVRVMRASAQKHAVVKIKEIGGAVYYEAADSNWWQTPPPWFRDSLGDHFFYVATRVDFFIDKQLGDEQLKPLEGLPHLKILNLAKADADGSCLNYVRWPEKLQALSIRNCNDVGMEKILRFTKLKALNLSGSQRLTVEGLRFLHHLEQLKSLDLIETPITNEGLLEVSKIRSLERLYLRGNVLKKTNINAAGLQHLIQLPNLQLLHLNHSTIADQDLRYLEAMSRLRTVLLRGTLVSKEAREDFSRRNPNIRIMEY